MNTLCHNIYDQIFNYLEKCDIILLTLLSKNITDILKDCKYWSIENKQFCNNYNFIKSSDNIKIYTKIYSSYCYQCKKRNLIKKSKDFTYNYNLCYICKNISIHFNKIKNIKDTQNKITCIKYPFYNLSEYLRYIREQKFVCMISKINKKKLELDCELNMRNLEYSPKSNVCRKYIFENINLSAKQVVNIYCKKKYIYEYTPYMTFKKFFYYDHNLTWAQAHKKALEFVLNNNRYPSKYPWEN
tara:strand:- start:414 stop:1142 length:729 start_codon:yes stop_codon:yes gene_type:complete